MSEIMRQLPRYQSHKKVWALKIKAIAFHYAGGATITPKDEGYTPFEVVQGYVDKHEPVPGGYWVQYDDGYQSFSPAHAFEDGYTRC
jgi:hypothetical protein